MGAMKEEPTQYSMKSLAAPVKKAVDKFQLLPEFLKVRGLVKQHIDSFNYFVNVEIKKIIHAKGNEIVSSDTDPSLYIKYLDIRMGKPSRRFDNIVEETTPQICRFTDTTYASPIWADIEYTKGNQHSKAVMKKVCTRCGLLGYYNQDLKLPFCSTCKTGEKVSTMRLPYARKLLIQELQSMNIVPRLQLAES